jgi:endonuclease IV
MTDPLFADIPRILETPKGDDETTNDRRMIALLRSWLPGGVVGVG